MAAHLALENVFERVALNPIMSPPSRLPNEISGQENLPGETLRHEIEDFLLLLNSEG